MTRYEETNISREVQTKIQSQALEISETSIALIQRWTGNWPLIFTDAKPWRCVLTHLFLISIAWTIRTGNLLESQASHIDGGRRENVHVGDSVLNATFVTTFLNVVGDQR